MAVTSKMEYKIVVGIHDARSGVNGLMMLMNEVNISIQERWVPIGGVTIDPSADKGRDIAYLQAMTRTTTTA